MLASHQVSHQKDELCGCQLVPGKALQMSLLEDVLDVLRIVLEYFGVPPDMVSAQIHICYTDSQTEIREYPGVPREIINKVTVIKFH